MPQIEHFTIKLKKSKNYKKLYMQEKLHVKEKCKTKLITNHAQETPLLTIKIDQLCSCIPLETKRVILNLKRSAEAVKTAQDALKENACFINPMQLKNTIEDLQTTLNRCFLTNFEDFDQKSLTIKSLKTTNDKILENIKHLLEKTNTLLTSDESKQVIINQCGHMATQSTIKHAQQAIVVLQNYWNTRSGENEAYSNGEKIPVDEAELGKSSLISKIYTIDIPKEAKLLENSKLIKLPAFLLKHLVEDTQSNNIALLPEGITLEKTNQLIKEALCLWEQNTKDSKKLSPFASLQQVVDASMLLSS